MTPTPLSNYPSHALTPSPIPSPPLRGGEGVSGGLTAQAALNNPDTSDTFRHLDLQGVGPLAAAPYTSYRYAGPYGGIAAGAMDDAEALREVARSLNSGSTPDAGLLQRWDGEQWIAVS